MKKAGLYLQSGFYIFAGVYHFVNPEFYLPLIPDYLPYHDLINVAAGIVEILFGVLLLFESSRRYAAIGIVLMLIAFIPSHIYFIQMNNCLGDLCVPDWVGWVRLLVIHPLLIWWAWSYRE